MNQEIIQEAKPVTKQANKYNPKTTPKRWVKVHRMGVDENNRFLPIVVLVNDIRSKREFTPGDPVELDDVQIQSLRDAAYNCAIQIPDDSAIYDSRNPLAAAEKMYEGMKAYHDPVTMKIWVKKNEQRYLIEELGDGYTPNGRN